MKHYLPNWLTLTRITWLLVVFFLLLSIWHLTSYVQYGRNPSLETTSVNPNLGAGHSINRERIVASPYFGQYLPEDAKDIQQADLDFVLVGVLYSENVKDSQVIVRQSNQEEKFYHMNDSLPGGAVVKKITENSVIILYDGKLQQLSLPKDSLAFEPKPKSLLIKE
ncbi:type II secretion system protein N [Legionella sp. W05-934-2]|uniref:type II secretion system protein N n=1 Tax=Legionella sp. W05-934-2 TaxID=1198649 RepID=UPI0034623CBA